MINELVCKMLWLKREEKVANQRASLEVPGCLLPTAMCSPGDTHEMSVRGEQNGWTICPTGVTAQPSAQEPDWPCVCHPESSQLSSQMLP